MKSRFAVVALVATVAIAGCDGRASDTAAEASAVTTPPTPNSVAVATPSALATGEDLDARPQFAVVYPDGELQGAPLAAAGPAGDGGVLTFLTEADPDAVIGFYRERAETSGLATMMALNQGEARAYGAQNQSSGASLNVVAAPTDGRTSVQLTWSAGH
jgi:hypothetical protein